MNRWTLRLMLVAAATIPLLTALVIPIRAGNKVFVVPSSQSASAGPSRMVSYIQMSQNDDSGSAGPPKQKINPPPSGKHTPTIGRRKKARVSYDRKKDPNGQPKDLTFQKPKADPFQADFRDSSEPKLMTTLGGGTALMFEMIAKRMLDWGNEARPYSTNDGTQQGYPTGNERRGQPSLADANNQVLPRWHPHSGISDANPNFRNQAPIMNNQGFAKTIWRNVRKRNKPSLWKHALRTYDRMAALEADPNYINIQRSNIHHEGAMLACAKLGLWQRALEIYHYVYQVEEESQSDFDQNQIRPLGGTTRTPTIRSSPSSVAALRRSRIRRTVHVTDNMIMSLIQACVRASQQRLRNKGTHLSPEEEEQEAALRRIPLDTALEVLTMLPETHNIPVVARDVNPLAAAYQSLGYISMATEILQTMLSNRTAGEEPEDGMDVINVFDLCAKDKGSYSLLVQGAVVIGDWGAAVDALSDMTAAGLYPKQRHCNIWSEISERRTRPRAVGSWKKKRNDYWVDSVR